MLSCRASGRDSPSSKEADRRRAFYGKHIVHCASYTKRSVDDLCANQNHRRSEHLSRHHKGRKATHTVCRRVYTLHMLDGSRGPCLTGERRAVLAPSTWMSKTGGTVHPCGGVDGRMTGLATWVNGWKRRGEIQANLVAAEQRGTS